MTFLETLLEAEGFRRKPYLDTRGTLTFGHGLTYITKKESVVIVKARIAEDAVELLQDRRWLKDRPSALIEILLEMRYQMGVEGVDRFVRMWAAILREDYALAAREMISSNWRKQTPGRCERLAAVMKELVPVPDAQNINPLARAGISPDAEGQKNIANKLNDDDPDKHR